MDDEERTRILRAVAAASGDARWEAHLQHLGTADADAAMRMLDDYETAHGAAEREPQRGAWTAHVPSVLFLGAVLVVVGFVTFRGATAAKVRKEGHG